MEGGELIRLGGLGYGGEIFGLRKVEECLKDAGRLNDLRIFNLAQAINYSTLTQPTPT